MVGGNTRRGSNGESVLFRACLHNVILIEGVYKMNKQSLSLELAAITPRIIELERKGKSAYTCTECAELWKEARRLTYLLKQLTL